MEFAILGPLEVRDAGRPVRLGSFKQRVLLGLLLCHANRIVPADTLNDGLWGDDLPRTARKNLQVHVSTLRRAIGADREGQVTLAHTPPGYTLRVEAARLDVLRFQYLVRTGRQAARDGDTARAADLLGLAVGLWRGDVLPELAQVPAVAAEADRLGEQYLYAYEDWAESQLSLGRHTQVVTAVEELAQRHPLRERLRHAQMLALYRSGRQTEALAQFDDLRQRLARELGLQPSPVLARLYKAILAGDGSLDQVGPDRIAPLNLRVVRSRRGGLSRDLADFTGRSGEVGKLLAALDRSGSVTTLTGPPGIGKTVLAVHCAHRLGLRYPHGRVLAAMRTAGGQARTTPDLLADLLCALGVAGDPPADENERAVLLRESTAGRDLLFVLDDALTEAQVRPVLDAGDATVLVTSRRHLGGLGSTAHVSLPPMPPVESLEMLSRIVGAGRVEEEPGAAARLVAICGGLPLLVRIVGTKLRTLEHLSLGRYAERLDDEVQLLDELQTGDLAVVSRLAQWYGDQTPQDRMVLNRLAALPAAAGTADDIAAALGTDTSSGERAIERLIEAHLVTAHPRLAGRPTYEVQPLLRAFIRQRNGAPAPLSRPASGLAG